MIEKNVPERIRSLKPYIPGKPIKELERELGIKNAIKLASNENPLGPSPKAMKRIKEFAKEVHFYPDGGCYYLREKLAQKLKVPPQCLVFGTGSNEIIELVIKAFGANKRAVIGTHSFLIYKIILSMYGAEIIEVPFKDFRYDVDGIIKTFSKNPTLIFIDSPNNPTGTIVTKDELKEIVRNLPQDTLLVVDEAYYEFVRSRDYESAIKYLKDGHKNILVLRTFSKAYGLAGLRIGYGVGSAEVIEILNKVRQPFNVNAVAQEAALSALDDTEHIRKTIELTQKGKDFLYKEFSKLGLDFVRSHSNFVLVKVGDGKMVFEKLLRKGIIVREMSAYGFPEYIRVTVGKMNELKRFIKALKEVLG